jgi:hypothetical protein
MEALQQMLQLEGWPLVEQHIKDEIERSKSRLLTCDLKEVIEHRARIKALNSVLLYIRDTINAGQEALAEQK